jgi:hypothetical protein
MSEEQSSNIPFSSSEGEISEIEDSESSSTVSISASFPIANVQSPTVSVQGESSIRSTSSILSSITIESQGLTILQQNLTMVSTPTPTTSTSSEVTFMDGYKVRVAAQPKSVNAVTEYVQISSADRSKLTPKEQNDVRHAITKKQHSLYDKMDLATTDLNQLVGFQSNLVNTERHFAKFDLRQIFMIVEPERDSDGNVLPTLKAGSTQRNLFQWYATLKIEEVVASNQWWSTHTEDPWFNENLGLTHEYLKSHTANSLWLKVSEEYDLYPADAKGGPLFLFLMINQLMADNDSIATTLSDKIDTIKISSYKGEDVGEVVTHLRGIIHRLKNMRRRDKAGNQIDLVPFDLTKRLYKVFQTSSSTEFNKLFANRYDHEYAESLISGSSAWSDPEKVLSLAGNLYYRLCSDNNWNGVNQNKATFPTFKSPKAASAFLSKVKCHNCGGEHYLRDCPEPKDQSRIEANQKRLRAAKKVAKKGDSKSSTKLINGHPPGGKFPQRPGKGQTNKCTVDGKQYFFHFKSQRWLPVDQQSKTASAPAAMTTAPATQGTNRHGSNADKSLAFSIFSNQFQDAISALESSLMGN